MDDRSNKLMSGTSYQLGDGRNNDVELYFVKMTESSLSALVEYRANALNLGSASIQFGETEGNMSIPRPNRSPARFNFNLTETEIGEDASFECIRQTRDGLEVVGDVPNRIRVNATDDSYEATRVRMTKAEETQKNKCTREIKPSLKEVGRRVKTKPTLPIMARNQTAANGQQASASSSSTAQRLREAMYQGVTSVGGSSGSSAAMATSSAPSASPMSAHSSHHGGTNGSHMSASSSQLPQLMNGGHHSNHNSNSASNSISNSTIASTSQQQPPVRANGTRPRQTAASNGGSNLDIAKVNLRVRIAHLLAIKPCKKVEIMQRLSQEGRSDRDRNSITPVLRSICVFSGMTYTLRRLEWNNIDENWPYYTEHERQLMLRSKPSNLTPPGGSDGSSTSGQSPTSTHNGSPPPAVKRPPTLLAEYKEQDATRLKKQRISHCTNNASITATRQRAGAVANRNSPAYGGESLAASGGGANKNGAAAAASTAAANGHRLTFGTTATIGSVNGGSSGYSGSSGSGSSNNVSSSSSASGGSTGATTTATATTTSSTTSNGKHRRAAERREATSAAANKSGNRSSQSNNRVNSPHGSTNGYHNNGASQMDISPASEAATNGFSGHSHRSSASSASSSSTASNNNNITNSHNGNSSSGHSHIHPLASGHHSSKNGNSSSSIGHNNNNGYPSSHKKSALNKQQQHQQQQQLLQEQQKQQNVMLQQQQKQRLHEQQQQQQQRLQQEQEQQRQQQEQEQQRLQLEQEQQRQLEQQQQRLQEQEQQLQQEREQQRLMDEHLILQEQQLQQRLQEEQQQQYSQQQQQHQYAQQQHHHHQQHQEQQQYHQQQQQQQHQQQHQQQQFHHPLQQINNNGAYHHHQDANATSAALNPDNLELGTGEQYDFTEFPEIADYAQRRAYKVKFEEIFREYRALHHYQVVISQEFHSMERDMVQNQTHGNLDDAQLAGQRIHAEYHAKLASPEYQEKVSRFAFLHFQLAHIKTKVNQFDSLIKQQNERLMASAV